MTWERDPERPADAAGEASLADEAAPEWRNHAPDVLSPIDESAPVSGHHPPLERERPPSEFAEREWPAASGQVMPILRPRGSAGTRLDALSPDSLAQAGQKHHALPVTDAGPMELEIAYVLRTGTFEVFINADHLLEWRIDPATLRSTAIANLGLWSSMAPWTDELSGERRLMSSDTGEGGDATRILLPEVRQHLAEELGAGGRVLVGLPDRDLLVAGTLVSGDGDFADLFRDFVTDHSSGADEPIDGRVFELVGGQLTPFQA